MVPLEFEDNCQNYTFGICQLVRYKVKTMATHTCDAKRWIKGPIVVFAEPTRDEPRTEMESCWERAEALDMDWMI
ncbi:UNVERIFIED_CONTAM: hypothetical protein FKN15_065154 [Acipenser sinensis]